MLKLAGIFQDNMVIQRNKPIQVWGTGTPGTIVTVSLFTATADTMVCADGSWKIALQPLCAGAGYTLVASDTAESIVIQNVAVGEVWLAGGQSNMELALKDSENGIKISEEYSGKTYGFIRSRNVLCWMKIRKSRKKTAHGRLRITGMWAKCPL